MQKILAMILTIGLMFNTLFGLLSQKYDVYENVRYGEAERDLVTVYVPKNAEKCKKLAGKGYITATMSYSLCAEGSGVTVYTMLDEIGMCIAALKEFSDEKGLNITKVAPSGYSAGGHISMLYCYTRADAAALEIAFTANRVGPADMTTAAWGESAYRLTSQLTGVEITKEMRENGEADRLCREISPVFYVNENSVPSLFAYAGNDPIVTKGNREAMEKTFSEVFGENGNGYRYVFYPLSGHGLLLDPVSEECYYDALYGFCETCFGY